MSRPTKGDIEANPDSGERGSTASHAVIGSRFPFALIGSSGSYLIEREVA